MTTFNLFIFIFEKLKDYIRSKVLLNLKIDINDT